MRKALVVAAMLMVAGACSGKVVVPDLTAGDTLGDGIAGDGIEPPVDLLEEDGNQPGKDQASEGGPGVDGQEQPEIIDIGPDLVCQPVCGGKECGDDGCGGSCGICDEGSYCNAQFLCQPLECVSSKDCPGALVCHKDLGICVECANDGDCLDGKLCNPWFKCYEPVACDSDKDCKEWGMVCNKEAAICVECLAHTDCSADEHCKLFFCFPNLCTPGEPACDGSDVMLCNEIGSELIFNYSCDESSYCDQGQCHPKVCEPGWTGCDGNVLATCDSLGKGYASEVDCGKDDLICFQGQCLDLLCPPALPFCLNDKSLGLCDELGESYETVTCEQGTYCSKDQCVLWLCEPEQPFCSSATVAATCNQFGSGPLPGGTDCAKDSKCCAAGSCIDPPAELCDQKDNNCNGLVDEGCDDDKDGWCDGNMLTISYPAACPNGAGDCNDQSAAANPGTKEVPGDGLDNDCDGKIDELEACEGICTGASVEAFLCALELCPNPPVVKAEMVSPSNDVITGAWAAVEQFGNLGNDLKPWTGKSIGLMATGPAQGTSHTTDLPGGTGIVDPFGKAGMSAFDVLEFRLTLKAPANAIGFSLDYVFLSVEYEEYVGSSFNDKFYLLLTAPTTTGNVPTVINWGKCSSPDSYFDFLAPGTNEKACFVGINSALSEPCSAPVTNISGTGFECGAPDAYHGSSTGWLTTAWPVAPGEQIELVLHIHDTSDGIFDSEVVLDNFQWLFKPFAPGTAKKVP